MRSRTTWVVILSLAVCVIGSYVLPSLVERSLAGRVGPYWAYVVLGDVVGCAALGALTRWSIGISLYLFLDVVETMLLQVHIISPTVMLWLADAVPTVLLCGLVIMVVRVRSGWHTDSKQS